MSDRQTCVGCGKLSAETETHYTLISPEHGWRVSRRRTAAGELLVEWRCPTCWQEYKQSPKAQRDAASISTPPPPPAPPPRRPSRG